MNHLKQIILFLFVISCSVSNGQLSRTDRIKSVADCSGSINVLHFTESNIQFSGNYGYLDEIGQISKSLIETNSVWLRMEPKIDGDFEFELSPELNFDFEYYLFRDNSGEFCNKDFEFIKTEKLILSDSLAFNPDEKKYESNGKLVGPIKARSDDVFYLLLHSKEIHQYSVNIKYQLHGIRKVQNVKVQNYKKIPSMRALRLKIRDKDSGEPVLANVTIKGIKLDNKLFLGSDFIFDAIRSKSTEIVVNAEGYFLHTSELVINVVENSEIIIEMERLAVGKKMKVEGLKFKQDSRDFIPTSYVALRRLLDFMILNSELKIEIQGHVNAPGLKSSGKVVKLSESRAKMAYLYLVENGVDKNRMTYVGLGNTQMLYPNPKTPEEEEANRRVEIIIVK